MSLKSICLFSFHAGLYGHTAVYYATKQIILVFGGYRFRIDNVRPSDVLYSLDLVSNKWNILQALPFNEVSCFAYLASILSQEGEKMFKLRKHTIHVIPFFVRSLVRLFLHSAA